MERIVTLVPSNSMERIFTLVPSNSMERIIALVDMDCFYVQVEQRFCPDLIGKPCVVEQGVGGMLLAVNYEARDFGLKRGGMSAKVAKQKCPDVHVFKVPELRGKPNLTRYREASSEVMEALSQFSECMERASIDEAYLDLTEEVKKRLKKECPLEEVTPQLLPNTFIEGWKPQRLGADIVEEEVVSGSPTNCREAALTDWLRSSCFQNESDRSLAVAAVIVEEMRAAVYEKTGFKCSAGISHNKVLAKLSCGLHKPNCQTILPRGSVPGLYETLPINKLKSLGGKLGCEIKEKLKIETMSEMSRVKEIHLQQLFGEKNGAFLFQLGQGIENDPVRSRQLAKSIGCGKNFYGCGGLKTKALVNHWVSEFSDELEERLINDQQKNNRVAKSLCISVRRRGDAGNTARSCPLLLYNRKSIARDTLTVLQKLNEAPPNSDSWYPAIFHLSLSASKFQDTSDCSSSNIESFFAKSAVVPVTQTASVSDLENDNSKILCKRSPTSMNTNVILHNTSIPSTSTGTPKICQKLFKSNGFFAQKVIDVKAKIPESILDFTQKPITHSTSSLPPEQFIQNILVREEDKATVVSAKENIEDQEDFENDFSYKCEHCNSIVSFQDMEEHADFHFAQKLQEQSRKIVINKTIPAKKLPSNSGNKKRKSNSKKSVSGKKMNMRPMEFYMK